MNDKLNEYVDGVFAGTMTAPHEAITYPGTPASSTVGVFGSAAERF